MAMCARRSEGRQDEDRMLPQCGNVELMSATSHFPSYPRSASIVIPHSGSAPAATTAMTDNIEANVATMVTSPSASLGTRSFITCGAEPPERNSDKAGRTRHKHFI